MSALIDGGADGKPAADVRDSEFLCDRVCVGDGHKGVGRGWEMSPGWDIPGGNSEGSIERERGVASASNRHGNRAAEEDVFKAEPLPVYLAVPSNLWPGLTRPPRFQLGGS